LVSINRGRLKPQCAIDQFLANRPAAVGRVLSGTAIHFFERLEDIYGIAAEIHTRVKVRHSEGSGDGGLLSSHVGSSGNGVIGSASNGSEARSR